eukprot:GHVU01195314.1.p1 GENE.GHVU01195314.1~~GHVU01195314.1.p1  ORF type:complete len:585 (+),score=126.53 GHVU01195314.1:175-1755(+)
MSTTGDWAPQRGHGGGNGEWDGTGSVSGSNMGGDHLSGQPAPLAENASPLLEEFRAGRRAFLLADIQWHLVEFSQDQVGSRFIQQKLETCSEEDKHNVFLGILKDANRLTTDVFGNYVIQKFFEFGTDEQKKMLAEQLVGDVYRLSLQMYGCRVIQKALDSVSVEQKARLVSELAPHVIKCVEDQNGNHVVQKCIESLPSENVEFIVDAFKGQVKRMSIHCYGCRVMQRLLEHCPHSQIGPLLDEVMKHVTELSHDQYGNYVVQHVIQHGRPDDKEAITETVSQHLLPLSVHKFASNVVEKSLIQSDGEARRRIVAAAIGDTSDNGLQSNPPIVTMTRDRYGNYVVQKMMEIVDGPQRKMLVDRLQKQQQSLRKVPYGKHILCALNKMVRSPSNGGSVDGGTGPPSSLGDGGGASPSSASGAGISAAQVSSLWGGQSPPTPSYPSQQAALSGVGASPPNSVGGLPTGLQGSGHRDALSASSLAAAAAVAAVNGRSTGDVLTSVQSSNVGQWGPRSPTNERAMGRSS